MDQTGTNKNEPKANETSGLTMTEQINKLPRFNATDYICKKCKQTTNYTYYGVCSQCFERKIKEKSLST